MPLSSFIQRLRQRSSANAPDAAALSSADIEVARVRARRRLVGMVVLVGAGVIGLPWLFETQPRPLATDVQVTSAVAPRGYAMPSGPAPAIAAVTEPRAEKPGPQAIQEEDAAPAPASKPAARPAAPPASKPVARPAPPASTPAAKPVAAPAREPAKPTPVATAVAANNAASKEAARARALLDDKPAAKPAPKPAAAAMAEAKPASKPTAEADTRYVVQIGAYSDVPAAREVRMKAERLGIKTYTQVVATPAGKKIRVRLGPYASKAEADKAMDALRKAGLTGAVLTL